MNYHDQLFEELILLRKAGLTEIEALPACTSNIYKTLELKYHSPIQAGSPASFLLIDRKPLKKIEDIRLAKRIWKNGQEISGT